MKSIFKKIEAITNQYQELELNKQVIDYEKYKLYSIVTSSTQLEGSTLDDIDTKLLLDDGLTAKGKPIEHHLMVMDNYQALRYILEQADKKKLLTPEFLQQCNSLNMANLTDTFCAEINRQILNNSSIIEHLTTSFDAHANLVLIHPWMDGNKRTSRLMMNFIQRRAELPLTKVHKEDSREYLFALKEVKDNKNLEVFRNFMYNQYIKTLNNEISDYIKSKKRGFHLVF